jgi:hypothetical protein
MKPAIDVECSGGGTMATETSSQSEASRRRSIARRFNDALSVKAPSKPVADPRSTRRLDRFRDEVVDGMSAGKVLSPFEVALRVDALLEAGDDLGELREKTTWKPVTQYDDETMVSVLREMHSTFKFVPEAYTFVGIKRATLVEAGVTKEAT